MVNGETELTSGRERFEMVGDRGGVETKKIEKRVEQRFGQGFGGRRGSRQQWASACLTWCTVVPA